MRQASHTSQPPTTSFVPGRASTYLQRACNSNRLSSLERSSLARHQAPHPRTQFIHPSTQFILLLWIVHFYTNSMINEFDDYYQIVQHGLAADSQVEKQSQRGDPLATVEVLNTETLQWSFPQMTTRGGCTDDKRNIFSSSVEDLLKSTKRDGGSVWTRLANFSSEIPGQRLPMVSWRTPTICWNLA